MKQKASVPRIRVPTVYLTFEELEDLGACDPALDRLKEMFGGTVAITRENLVKFCTGRFEGTEYWLVCRLLEEWRRSEWMYEWRLQTFRTRGEIAVGKRKEWKERSIQMLLLMLYGEINR